MLHKHTRTTGSVRDFATAAVAARAWRHDPWTVTLPDHDTLQCAQRLRCAAMLMPVVVLLLVAVVEWRAGRCDRPAGARWSHRLRPGRLALQLPVGVTPSAHWNCRDEVIDRLSGAKSVARAPMWSLAILELGAVRSRQFGSIAPSANATATATNSHCFKFDPNQISN